MKKIISVLVLAVLLMTLTLPMAVAEEEGWVLPNHSVMRHLNRNYGTTSAWTATRDSRALLIAAAMGDVAGSDTYFAHCTDALDNGCVYLAYNPFQVGLFFISESKGCLMLVFDPADMTLDPMTATSIRPSYAIALMEDGKAQGVFSTYWKIEKADVIPQLGYVVTVMEELGWND